MANFSVETLHARLERDPESGRKMINQYIVKHEIGHGTHGRVRLGEEVTVELNGEAGPSIRQLYVRIHYDGHNTRWG